VLAHDWRERRLLTLEQAVHKMSGMAAKNFRIEGRGQLRVGACADVVVFDPVRIQDLATYHEPIRPSVGVCAVYVNDSVCAATRKVPARWLAPAGC
jgi:N-acyl-D-amino-acid deacylase